MQEQRVRETDVTGSGGVRLSVRVHDGPATPDATLLLHHGLASTQRIWDLMLPRLSRRFRVVTYDARGHGRSAKPSSGYGFGPVVGDALAVMRATRAGRPLLIGHSWGAAVALEVAAARPRAVDGVVLVDGGLTSPADSMDWPTARARLAPPRLAGMPVDEFRRSIHLHVPIDVTEDVERIVLSVMRVDRSGRIHPRLSRANHLRILRAMWLRTPNDTLRRLTVPTLAILARGAGDDAWDREKRRAARRAAASGAPVRMSWIRGIHDLPLQHPDVLCARIERFAGQLVR